jgi:hypothetical protein
LGWWIGGLVDWWIGGLVVSLDWGWKIILARVYMSSISSGDDSIIEAFCIQYLL